MGYGEKIVFLIGVRHAFHVSARVLGNPSGFKMFSEIIGEVRFSGTLGANDGYLFYGWKFKCVHEIVLTRSVGTKKNNMQGSVDGSCEFISFERRKAVVVQRFTERMRYADKRRKIVNVNRGIRQKFG